MQIQANPLGPKHKAVRPCCGSIFLFVFGQTHQQQLYQVILGEESHQQRLFTCFAKFLSIWCALVIFLAFSRLAPIIDNKMCHKVIPIRFFSDSFGGSFENDPWQLKTDGIYLIYSFCDPDCITIPNTQCMEASIPPEDEAITRSIFHLSTYFDARQYSEISQKRKNVSVISVS